MVEHCSFFNKKGYDPYKSLKSSPPDYLYFTNNLILFDLKQYREGNYADKIRNYYNLQIERFGYDRYTLSQDLINPG